MAGKTITYVGFSPHQGQSRLLKEIFERDTFHNVVTCPRQYGKSFMLYNLALFYGINNKKVNVVWASPIHSQAKYAMGQIYAAIKNSGILLEYNKTERKITLINGSTLYFTGTEKYENIRGLNTHYLIVDEAAYCNPKAINDVLIPSMSTVGRKAFYVSTPRSKNNFFYDFYVNGEMGIPMYASYMGYLDENPFRNVNLIESEKLTKPSYVYEQEYLCKFLDSEFMLFKNIDELAVGQFHEPIPGTKYYAGMDVARTHDFTVLTILDQAGNVVYVYRDNQKSWEHMINVAVGLLNKYNKANCYLEVNGVGDVAYEMMKKKYSNVHPFETYANKSDLIERLIVKFELKEIYIPSKEVFPHLYSELQAFEFEYSPKSRVVKYAARPPFHDDTVMSLAMAAAAYDRWNKRGGITIR